MVRSRASPVKTGIPPGQVSRRKNEEVSRLWATALCSLLLGLSGGVFVGVRLRRWRRKVMLRTLHLLRSRRLRRHGKVLALGSFAVGMVFAVVGLLTMARVVL